MTTKYYALFRDGKVCTLPIFLSAKEINNTDVWTTEKKQRHDQQYMTPPMFLLKEQAEKFLEEAIRLTSIPKSTYVQLVEVSMTAV